MNVKTKLTSPHLQHYQKIISFFGSPEFKKASLVAIAVSIPAALGISLGFAEIGIAMAFGAFWCSPGFVIGNFPDNLRNILFSTGMITLVTLSVGILKTSLWFTFPGLFLLTFLLSFISLYGQRAAMVSLSGLLALVLGFAFTPKALSIYMFAAFTGAGGIWYLGLAVLWNRFMRQSPIDQLLLETLEKSAAFLRTRGTLLEEAGNKKKKRLKKLIRLQAELSELHEALRDHILRDYREAGRSVNRDRQVLLLIELVDLLETALANPLDYDSIPHGEEPAIALRQEFSQFICVMAEDLAGKRPVKQDGLTSALRTTDGVERSLLQQRETLSFESYLFFRNLLDYLEAQRKRVDKIIWLYSGDFQGELKVPDRESLLKFIPTQDYDPVLLWRNFNFGSSIFRHSLRLALALVFGYALGLGLNFQNPYWIMLTVIVILRPNYGMTKQRFRERLIGTLVGALLALLIVLWLHNDYILAALGIVSIVFAFSYLQKNYRLAATFITTGVIFIYAIIRPDIWSVVQFRVLDTLIGALLSFLAASFLFPVWEYLEIDGCIRSSLSAKMKFLEEIRSYYTLKGKLPTSYKLARKDAYLANARLRSAFIRMTQDPPSKQKNLDKFSELVVLDHSFLTALSSLGSHIRHRPTTAPSEEFNGAIDKVKQMFETMIDQLDGKEQDRFCRPAEEGWTELAELTQARDRRKTAKEEDLWKVQEAYLVLEQLRWLHDLGLRMCSLLGRVYGN